MTQCVTQPQQLKSSIDNKHSVTSLGYQRLLHCSRTPLCVFDLCCLSSRVHLILLPVPSNMTLALIRTTCLRRAPSRCLASFHMTCFHKSTLAFTSMNQSVVTSPRITVSTSKSPWSGGGHHLSFSTSSSSSDLVQIDTDPDSGIATLTMTHGPVNSLSLEMCQALSNAIQTVESDKKLQVLLLKSSNPSIFSAGLDLLEMHQAPTKLPRLRDFWTSFQQLYLDLYGSRLACIAVIEGHAPAAGCMLALSCDYRIMKHTPKSTIGLNETKLGT